MNKLWCKSTYLWANRLLALMMATMLVIGCFSVGGFADVNKRYAKIADIKGTVALMKSGGEREFKAFNGMSVSEGDRIKTGIGSSVVLKVDDTKTVRIADNTTMDVADLKGSLDSGQTSMQLWGGKVVVSITKKLGNDEKFDIKTPTAIMGVRGTMFFVGQDQGRTDVAVLEGTVVATTYMPPQEGGGGSSGTPQEPVEVLLGVNQGVTLTPEVKTPEQVVRTEIVGPQSLDLMVLEAIKEEPTRVSPEILKGIDEVIQQKQIEQEKINENLQQLQQQQQQQLNQLTPSGQPQAQPEIIFAPEAPPTLPGAPETPGTPEQIPGPPAPTDTPSVGGNTGPGTSNNDRDHGTTTPVVQPVTPPVVDPVTPVLSDITLETVVANNTMSTYKQMAEFRITPGATATVTVTDSTPGVSGDDPVAIQTYTDSPGYLDILLTATGTCYDTTVTLHITVTKSGYTTGTLDVPVLVERSAAELAKLREKTTLSSFGTYLSESGQGYSYWHPLMPDMISGNMPAYFYWFNANQGLDYTSTADTFNSAVVVVGNAAVNLIGDYDNSATPLTTELLTYAGAEPGSIITGNLQLYSDVLAAMEKAQKGDSNDLNHVILFVNASEDYTPPAITSPSGLEPSFTLQQYATWATNYAVKDFPIPYYEAILETGTLYSSLYPYAPAQPVTITMYRPETAPYYNQVDINLTLYYVPQSPYKVVKTYRLSVPDAGPPEFQFLSETWYMGPY